jgi:hypothetical protein
MAFGIWEAVLKGAQDGPGDKRRCISTHAGDLPHEGAADVGGL